MEMGANVYGKKRESHVNRGARGACAQSLMESGATVIVIAHDLDVIRNADYILDMGPGGGTEGGTIVACGTVENVRSCEQSVTGRYL